MNDLKKKEDKEKLKMQSQPKACQPQKCWFLDRLWGVVLSLVPVM